MSVVPLSSSAMTGKVLAIGAGIVLAGLAAAAAADDPPIYRGPAEVVGPAMLSLAGKRIVLYGIDAPVKGQPCYVGSKTWDCSTASAKTIELRGPIPEELRDGIGKDPPQSCRDARDRL